MFRYWKPRCAILFAIGAANFAARAQQGGAAAAAEKRAIEFLQREVPAWSRENGCFSCHNNGDAARALYAAQARGHRLPSKALADTTAWISKPARWEHNKGDPAFNDTRLANLQFAAALAGAFQAGETKNRTALEEAARKVAADQDADGAWQIEPANAVGSPVTYGTTLATYMALNTLRAARLSETDEAIRKAEQWLRARTPTNVLTAATLLLFLSHDRDQSVEARKHECLGVILGAQLEKGGWGPYRDSPPECFDTAVVLLALAEVRSLPDVRDAMTKGRRFLTTHQRVDGSWPPTTRPPGGDSYAQSISTTAWATLALLATRE